MNDDLKHIDNFYKKSLEDYEEGSSKDLWEKLRWRLAWVDLRKLFIGAVIIGFIGLTGFLVYNFMNGEEIKMEAGPGISEIQTAGHSTEIKTAGTIAQNDTPDETGRENEAQKPTIENGSPQTIKPQTDHYTKNTSASFTSDYNHSTEAEILDYSVNSEPLPVQDAVVQTSEINKTETIKCENIPLNRILSGHGRIIRDTLYDTSDDLYFPEKNKIMVSMDLYLNPAYVTSTLNAGTEYGDYIKYRTDNESLMISWSAGAEVQFSLHNWYVQTGINYSVYGENRNYHYNYRELDSTGSYFRIDTTWVWVFNPPEIGVLTPVAFDSTWVPVYREMELINQGRNEWKYLEVPIIFGYKIQHSRFTFDIGTGLSLGFLLQANGYVPVNAHAYEFNKLKDMGDRMNKVMINYILQLGVGYQLDENFSIFIKPNYRQNLQSVFKQDYPVEQKYKVFGIKVGINIKL